MAQNLPNPETSIALSGPLGFGMLSLYVLNLRSESP